MRIEPKQLGTSEVQYIFGRMTQAKYEELQRNRVKNLPQVGSLGLFLPSQDAILPASFGDQLGSGCFTALLHIHVA